jgi:peptidoglycan/LPS O-acetylase OafA/YrhL
VGVGNSQQPKRPMDYRKEIDGLRAIAVIPVLLFHAGFEGFSGGFVGVDVFFVISGYLITTIIMVELDQGKFSLVNFYERRARRILPALFTVMLFCIPFAWYLLTPNDMRDFSQSLLAVVAFSSNFLFWRESGYFATAAELKPLLHTWSLAVEEQFYVFFPLFLMLLWRLGKFWMCFSLCLVLFLSLALAQWATEAMPSAAFYLLPTRVWELLIGALTAFYLKHSNRKEFNRNLSELGGWLGLALIIYSVFTYSKATPFPGIYALIPTIGAMLIILFATSTTSIGNFVGNKVFVGIGLISYSAYLWHQPLFAFARRIRGSEPSSLVFCLLLLITLILAFLTWKYIENYSKINLKNRKHIIIYAFCFLLLFLFFGLFGHFSNGFEKLMLKYKYSEESRSEVQMVLDATNYDMYQEMQVKDCHLWVRNSKFLDKIKLNDCRKKYGNAIIILGDSHAMNLFNIVSYMQKNPFVIGISQGDCRPHNNNELCHYNDFEKFILEYRSTIGLIIFHQSGSYFIKDKSGEVGSQSAFLGKFESFDIDNIIKNKNYLNGLALNYNLRILWIGPFLEFRWNPLEKLFTNEIKSVNPNSIYLFRNLEYSINAVLGESISFKYLSFRSLFNEPTHSFEGDCFLFRDGDHYSRCGERFIAKTSTPYLMFDLAP